jgi:type I restriction enzyme S subunit
MKSLSQSDRAHLHLRRLDECCTLVMGQSPPGESYSADPVGLPFFQGKADFGPLHPQARVWCSNPFRIAEKGDILICVRAPVGPVNVADQRCCIGRGLAAVRPRDSMDGGYLYWWLHNSQEQLQALGSGSTFQSIGRPVLAAFEVPVPPLSDQQRIVAKLDEQMAALDRAEHALEDELQSANTILPRTAMTEMQHARTRGDNLVQVGQVCEFLDARRVPVSQQERGRRVAGKRPSDLYPYYGANGQAGWIDDYLFEGPSILLAEDGGNFGSSLKPIVYGVGGRYWVNNHAHILRPMLDRIDFDYCLWALSYRPDVGSIVGGSTRGKLTQELAASIEMPLPELQEQRRVAARLTQVSTHASVLAQHVHDQQANLAALREGLLNAAFTGEV